MPELPEVESLRRALAPLVLGRRVISAKLLRRDIVIAPGDPVGGISRRRVTGQTAAMPRRVLAADLLAGSVIEALERRGKQLAIIGRVDTNRASTDPPAGRGGRVGPSERVLIVQLGMSGQVLHTPPGARTAAHDHVHAVWRLDDGSRLCFRDPRRFGALRALASRELRDQVWSGLGPDALTLTGDELTAGLASTTRAIKPALMDQRVAAGVGNIYADESLFLAGIDPHRTADSLTADDIARLAGTIRLVLSAAVQEGGSTLRDYVDPVGRAGGYQANHRVYGRGGKPCTSCGRALLHDRLGQRATVWCGACQR